MTTIIQAIILLLSTLFQAIILLLSTLQTSPCQQGGQELREHVSPVNTICPRNTYSPDLPTATCPACIRTVSTLADGTLSMAMQLTYHSDCPTSYPAPSYPAPSYPAPSYPVLSYPAPSCSTPCTSGSTPSHPTSSTPCHTSCYF